MCLRTIYRYKILTFEGHLEKRWLCFRTSPNLQVLATEMFQIRKGLSTSFMSDLFKIKMDPCYNLRANDNFYFPSVNMVFNSLKSISFLWLKIWYLSHLTFSIHELENFRKFIKIWKAEKSIFTRYHSYVKN